MKPCTRGLAMALLVVVVEGACGGDDNKPTTPAPSSGSGGSPGNVPAPPPPPATPGNPANPGAAGNPDGGAVAGGEFLQACSAYATAVCAKLMACERSRLITDYGDMGTCASRRTTQCQAA